ncbi:MAG: hypothetical protein DDT20_01753 [Firmicutes bacterium]|nr:hypothetical protein [Bacillota bacterium]
MQQNLQGSSWGILDNYTGLVTIGTLMSLAAGTINGIATNAIVFDRVSHLTGRVNNMLRDLWTNPWHGLLVVGIVYIFVLGTFLGGKMLPRLGLTRSLLVSIVPLVLVCILLYVSRVTATPKDLYFPVRYMMAYLLALAMGLQNSVTSQTALGRTTHFTGDLTDMGLAFADHKWRQAGYIFAKHLGFACGGFAGFLFSRSMPEYIGIAVATGCLVAIVLYASRLSTSAVHW